MNNIWTWLNTPHWDLVAILGGTLLGAILGGLLDLSRKLTQITSLLERIAANTSRL
jgi:hypothetical protein